MAIKGNVTTDLSTVALPEFTDLVRRNFVITQQFLDRNAKQMFVYDYIGEGQGGSKLYDEYDTDTFADDKPEGTAAKKAKVGVGYQKIMYAKTIAKQIDITYEERVQNRYQNVKAKITSLNDFCANRIDLDLTHRLTFATSTSYTDMNGATVDTTTGDGLSLANTAHTLAFSPITYSNRVAADPAFSQTAFQAAMLLGATQIYNNLGQQRQMNFNVVFSYNDPATIQAIDQLIHSMADVDAVQAGILNVYREKFTRVMLPYLASTAVGAYDSTKRRWWGYAAIGQDLNGWQGIYGEWVPPFLKVPAPGNNGENIDTWSWTYSTGAMYGIVTVSPRGIIFSCPTN